MNKTKRFALLVALFAIVTYMQTTTTTLQRELQIKDEEVINTEEDITFEIEETSNATATSTKPVMNTFYERVSGGCCGMTEQGHENLLKAWKQAWEDRGWDTNVLTQADAKKHPEFDAIEEILENLDVSPYNRRCFWRWLAMAAIEDDNGGGGWMSDYDVFPLGLGAEEGLEIAKDGGFKSYSVHVPCIIHASSEEWDRVLHLMIDVIPIRKNSLVTDMYMLDDVMRHYGKEANMAVWARQATGFPYEKNEDGELVVNCDKIVREESKVAHLSHRDCDEAFEKYDIYPKLDGVENPNQAIERRAEAALIVMKDYREQCLEGSSGEKLEEK